jgi:hypothetical protein
MLRFAEDLQLWLKSNIIARVLVIDGLERLVGVVVYVGTVNSCVKDIDSYKKRLSKGRIYNENENFVTA